VVTLPLVAVVPVPEFDEAASKGFRGSRPPYSAMRRSAYGTALENRAVTVFAAAPAALMFLA
jgi:hypothetical protein